eukprot:364988-Chlamydomonas_euryale.AAC.15
MHSSLFPLQPDCMMHLSDADTYPTQIMTPCMQRGWHAISDPCRVASFSGSVCLSLIPCHSCSMSHFLSCSFYPSLPPSLPPLSLCFPPPTLSPTLPVSRAPFQPPTRFPLRPDSRLPPTIPYPAYSPMHPPPGTSSPSTVCGPSTRAAAGLRSATATIRLTKTRSQTCYRS